MLPGHGGRDHVSCRGRARGQWSKILTITPKAHPITFLTFFDYPTLADAHSTARSRSRAHDCVHTDVGPSCKPSTVVDKTYFCSIRSFTLPLHIHIHIHIPYRYVSWCEQLDSLQTPCSDTAPISIVLTHALNQAPHSQYTQCLILHVRCLRQLTPRRVAV